MNSDRIEGMWQQVSGSLRACLRMPSVTPAVGAGNSTIESAATGSDAGCRQPDSPFVLVARRASGRWDVYAKAFDQPLASFSERQAACDYASDLAKTRQDAMVLIRDRHGSAAAFDPAAAIQSMSSFFIRMRRS